MLNKFENKIIPIEKFMNWIESETILLAELNYVVKTKCVKVFKNEPSKICEIQPPKTLKWYGLPKQTISFKFFKGCLSWILLAPFLNTLAQMIMLSSVN